MMKEIKTEDKFALSRIILTRLTPLTVCSREHVSLIMASAR